MQELLWRTSWMLLKEKSQPIGLKQTISPIGSNHDKYVLTLFVYLITIISLILMRTYIFLLFCILLLSQACTKVPSQKDFIVFSLENNPLEKEISLADIADISYFQPSNENPDYLFRNRPLIKEGEEKVLLFDFPSGSFLFFDKSGKALRHFNHKGNGPGEYTMLTGFIYDEKRDEIFTYFKNQMHVYDSNGTYKRSLSLPDKSWITEAIDFDTNHLLIYDSEAKYQIALSAIAEPQQEVVSDQEVKKESHEKPFVLISKETGAAVQYLSIPEDNNIQLNVTENIAGNNIVFTAKTNRIIPTHNGAILYNQETDTLFYLGQDLHLTPQAVRTPSIMTTQPVVYINGYIESAGYQFLECTPLQVERGQFKPTFLFRDPHDGKLYKQLLKLPDYEGKTFTLSPNVLVKGTTACIELPMEDLQTAFQENRLKGDLARLVSKSNEEANNVYMFLHFRFP